MPCFKAGNRPIPWSDSAEDTIAMSETGEPMSATTSRDRVEAHEAKFATLGGIHHLIFLIHPGCYEKLEAEAIRAAARRRRGKVELQDIFLDNGRRLFGLKHTKGEPAI